MRLQDRLPVWLRNPATWFFHGLVVFAAGIVGVLIALLLSLVIAAADNFPVPLATAGATWLFYIVREYLENRKRIKAGTLDDESKLDSLGDAIMGPAAGFTYVWWLLV